VGRCATLVDHFLIACHSPISVTNEEPAMPLHPAGLAKTKIFRRTWTLSELL